jgi:acetylornithine/LysW-gamma-L-lysine aminotransferase
MITLTPAPPMASTAAPGPSVHDAGCSGHRGLQLTHGIGPFVFDQRGRRYLDATSQYGVASLGHAHPNLVHALSSQAARLTSCFASFGNDQRDRLFARLARLLDPLDRFFLCNSGTEANEALFKWARAVTGRPGVVSFKGAFHGRTFGSLSASAPARRQATFDPLVPGFRHVPAGRIELLEAELEQSDVGLVLTEVIQGEGGVRPLDALFLRQARELCRERGVLFAVDEVQTGFGRTGRWFAFRNPELDPDAVTLAKGLGGGVPIGALAYRSELGDLPRGEHGSTFGGNPLAAAAAVAVIDTLENHDLVGRSAEFGRRLLSLLDGELAENPRVRAVRGVGLMIGIELTEAAGPCQKRLQERGFLVLGAGPRVLRLLPPLVTPWDELESLARAIVEVLEA